MSQRGGSLKTPRTAVRVRHDRSRQGSVGFAALREVKQRPTSRCPHRNLEHPVGRPRQREGRSRQRGRRRPRLRRPVRRQKDRQVCFPGKATSLMLARNWGYPPAARRPQESTALEPIPMDRGGLPRFGGSPERALRQGRQRDRHRSVNRRRRLYSLGWGARHQRPKRLDALVRTTKLGLRHSKGSRIGAPQTERSSA